MPEPITAAGGVVYQIEPESDQILVLLIYRNGYWDLPKGKLEKRESVAMCAVREVAEETNSELPIIISSLGTTYHEYREKKKYFGKTTHWYSMVFPRIQALYPQKSEGIERIEWIELQKALDMVGFDNLKEVLRTFTKSQA